MATAPITTRGPQVARFFEKYLKHRKGARAGEEFILEPFQRMFFDEFEERENGRRVYTSGYLGIPRGNGKTPMVAGRGLLELLQNRDAPDVFAIAGARDQARILLDFARAFVEDNEKLGGPEGRGWIKPSRNFLSCHENHGVMKVLASAGLTVHGLDPTCGLVDELHAVVQPQQVEAINALITALHKRPDAFLLAITTAGFDKETMLGQAYEQALLYPDGEDLLEGCLRIRRDRENGVLFYWYGIPEQHAEDWRNEELWRHANPASWVSIEGLRRQLGNPLMHELDFQRLHLNMWTKVRESWLPSGCWVGLRSDLEIPLGAPIYVGVDVGLTHDTTAVVWAWRAEDGRVVLRAHVWSVLPQLPAHDYVAGGRMRLDLVGEFLRELGERYLLEEVVFDPALFAAEADRLSDAGVAPMFALAQNSGPMTEAYQGFYQACREGTVAHNGDRVLAAHVEATAADRTERGWRPRKLKSTQVIDACVAACMAHYRAARGEGSSIYETQDLFGLEVPFDEDEDEEE